ncbi:clustered mitochondria-domain-containing protein [Powellomyces hirtus]|nr:clustered mitochondria-domain-containing protein [Powellomyces hirtus]
MTTDTTQPPVEAPTESPETDVKSTLPTQAENGEEQESVANGDQEVALEEQTFLLKVCLPDKLPAIKLYAHAHTIVQDVRQAVFDAPDVNGYTCFYLTFDGRRLSEYMELGDIEGFTPDSELVLAPDAYNDRELRVHLTRFREIMSNFGPQPASHGVDRGSSYLKYIDGREEYGANDAKGTKSKGKKQKSAIATDGIHAFEEYDFTYGRSSLLSDYIPKGAGELETLTPLKSLGLSTWNPSTADRRSDGDLMYLRAVTLEAEVLHVTCCVSGFFVNSSTDEEFDPEPRAGKSWHEHNFAVTLSKASPLFAKRYSRLLQKVQTRNPLEYIATMAGAYPWAVRSPVHTADESRGLDAHLAATDLAEGFGSHDWNEELQSTRELPQGTAQESVMRDQALYRVNSDFVESATKGALAVLSGNAIPLNPQEPSTSQMFVYNNIFYSIGYDNREAFEYLGGDAASHVAISKDVDGVKMLADLEIPGLYTLGTVVVDYMGQRVVAQSIIPGILTRSENPLVKYGSVDMGAEVASDPAFHALAETLANALHLSEHSVKDAQGAEHKLFTSVETKGIVGQDERKYFLDLYRLTPVDAEFLDEISSPEDSNEQAPQEHAYPHRLVLLRPELLKHFYDHKVRAVMEEEAKKKEADMAAEKAADKGEESKDAAKAFADAKPAENGAAGEKSADSEAAEAKIPKIDLRWNPDAFTRVPTSDAPETVEAHKEQVREISKFLRTTTLNRLVVDCLYQNPPIDSETLVRRFHARGVNMRYIGKVMKLAEDLATDATAKSSHVPSAYFLKLCRQEMIARGAKHVLRALLKDTPSYLMRQAVARFFSCFFADNNIEFDASSTNTIHSRIITKKHAFTTLTPQQVHESVRREVACRFRFAELPEKFWADRSLPLLRSICLKVGLQIEAVDYFAFQASPKPRFEPKHIIAHYPITKHHDPRAVLAEETLETAHISVTAQPALAVEIYTEACTVFEQTYGPVHADTARAYTGLALAYHRAGDTEKALAVERKAVVVGERVLGLDSEEVMGWYMNLAYFEYLQASTVLAEFQKKATAETKMDKERRDRDIGVGRALKLMKHASKLWEKVCGGDRNLEGASTDTNISAMLSEVEQFATATRFLHRALETQSQIVGKSHQLTITTQEALVKLYLQQGDFHAAVSAQKAVCEFLRTRLPATDDRAITAEAILAGITERAVHEAKLAAASKAPKPKQQKQRQTLQQPQQRNGVQTVTPSAAPSSSQQLQGRSSAGPQSSAKSEPSIEELLAFIGEKNSAPSSKKSRPKKSSSK